MENRCGQVFTYQVDGGKSKFIEVGDRHDTRYDYLEVGTTIDSIFESEQSSSSNATVGNCHYGIRVYPTTAFEESHYTNKA